jgi:hypothetical protein
MSTSKSRANLSQSPSTSSRTESLSPSNSMSTPAPSIRKSPPSLPSLDSSAWDHPMMMTKDSMSGPSHPSSASSAFSLTSISGPSSSQAHHPSFGFSDPMPSRNSQSAALFMPPGSQNVSHTAERSTSVRDYSDADLIIRDHRDDRHHYSYSQPSFPSQHEQGTLHSPHDTSGMNALSLPQHRDSASSQSFIHRRSITEPQGFRGIINQFPHLPNPQPHNQQQNYSIRLPTPPKVADPGGSRSGYNGTDSRRML